MAMVNDCQKLLDNNYNIVLFKNGLGSYTAVAVKKGQTLEEAVEIERQVTDDFTPSKALYRLTEKVTTGRIVNDQ